MMLSYLCLRVEFLRFSSSPISIGSFKGFRLEQKSCQSQAPVVRCEFWVEAPAAAQFSRRDALTVALAGVSVFLPPNEFSRAGAITEGKQVNLSVEQVKGHLVDGIPQTQEQCRIKVGNLKKRYKVEREKKKVSGNGTSKWIFYDMMDELIGSNPRYMRSGGGLRGHDSPLALENGITPLSIRSSKEETGFTTWRVREAEVIKRQGRSLSSRRYRDAEKRKRVLEDMDREHVN